jgi:hypothetical protein
MLTVPPADPLYLCRSYIILSRLCTTTVNRRKYDRKAKVTRGATEGINISSDDPSAPKDLQPYLHQVYM